jgi:antitoxin component of RelBE/YafQ-DinJ toxin-antitoxin module
MKVHLHVMVDEDVRRQADRLAAATGLTLGAVVNMALKRGLPPLAAALSQSPEEDGQ